LLDYLCQSLDQAGAAAPPLLVAGDASFCNRMLFRPVRERIDWLCRRRADGRLWGPAAAGSRRVYGLEKFTPRQVKQNNSTPWPTSQWWHGGQRRKRRYKEQLGGWWWQTGAGPRRLRRLVVAPIPYRRTQCSRLYERRPAFVLTTDLITPARELWPVCLDRWEIEVNHRKQKTTWGVGQAPGRSTNSLGRPPALVVAAYSALWLAGLQAYGPTRATVSRGWPKGRRPRAGGVRNFV
jgi:hypothetical protein